MTVKLFEKIKEIVDVIFMKIKKVFNINISNEDLVSIYYNIYLTSHGIRTGTFIDNFTNFTNFKIIFEKLKTIEEFNKYFTDLFKPLKGITNIGVSIGAYYDSSKFKDTIYVYNKLCYNQIKNSMKFLNDRIDKNKEIDTISIKLHSHIANLLGYDKIKRDYKEAFDHTKTLQISYILCDFKNKKRFEILRYVSYKNNLVKAYERLQKMNNLPIIDRYGKFRFLLEVDDVGV